MAERTLEDEATDEFASSKDEYSILNSKHFIGIHGYMIVYSVASKQSFEMARIIRDKILNHLVRNNIPLPADDADWELQGHRMGTHRHRRQQKRSEAGTTTSPTREWQSSRRGVQVRMDGGQCAVQRECLKGL